MLCRQFYLIKQTLTELRYMLSICKNYVDAYKILFSASKNQLLHFRKSNTQEKNTLEMNNKTIIESTNKCVYLNSTTCLYME